MTSPTLAEDSYEIVVEEAIAMCGGDMRGALMALLVANEHLETELARLRDNIISCSSGARLGLLN
ncbi:MAG: hypothetical protein EKK40_16100 [Bradyrhizobiaceae bacterium]|nr:MAG: hypothetical protein EKK40_16100 [Bradyrhizobiaceae bacterium]